MEVVSHCYQFLLEAELQLDLCPETNKKGIIHPVFALQYLSKIILVSKERLAQENCSLMIMD